MGNQSSFQNHLDIADIQTNYTYDVKYTDTRFGELKLWKKKDSGERIFQKDFSTNSGKEFEDYIGRIKNRIPLLHPNILQIMGYNSKKEDMFCADFYKVSLFFETFETDLEKEIYKRSANKNYYTETELRVLLDSVVAAGAYLQKNEIAHGDIRPFNIFITKNKEYKICDSHLFQSVYNPTYFGLLGGLEAKNHYPSPQVFKHYRDTSGKGAEFNKYKNDVYGLGMSVLTAAQLEKLDHIYDYEKKTVKQDAIDSSLSKLKGRYSDGFIDALRILLNSSEDQRPDFIQLDDEIKSYRNDVRAQANLERRLEAQKKQQQEHVVRSTPKGETGANPYSIDDELDKRVRKAVEKSESQINRSPSKYKNHDLDNYIHAYLKKDPLPEDKPLLYSISPHLTMHAKIVPTLKVYTQENSNLSASQYRMADVNNYIFGSGQTSSAVNQGYYSEPRYQQERPVQVETFGVGTEHAGYGGHSQTNPVESVENLRRNEPGYDVYSSNNYGGYGIPSEPNEAKNISTSAQYGGYGASYGGANGGYQPSYANYAQQNY